MEEFPTPLEARVEKYYNGPDGILYVDGDKEANDAMLKAARGSDLSIIAHSVEAGPFVPRLKTKDRRILGVEAIVDFFENS